LTSDLSKGLRIAVAKAGGQKIVALKLGMSESELSRKLSGERSWKISELQRLFEITGLHLSTAGSGNDDDFLLIAELSRKLSETMRALSEMASDRDKPKSGEGGSET
jgi:hypothetical protein